MMTRTKKPFTHPCSRVAAILTLMCGLAANGLAQRYDLPASPLSDEELAAALGAHMDELAEQDRFSGSALVALDDTTIFSATYGLASKRFGVPNRIDTKFNMGSMNKMFTGVAICQLVEEGLLAFDGLVGEYLPDYPNAEVAGTVTLHHLLTHTSGLGSYWNDEWQARFTSLRSVSDLLPLFVDEPLAFAPGERMQYSNAGPIVLGLVIEAVSGKSYYDYIKEHIYGPAGMEDSGCYEMDVPVPNLAIGYMRDPEVEEAGFGPWRNNLFAHSVRGGPAGGGFSTVGDLLRFSRALQSGVLLSTGMVEMLVTGKVSMGPGAQYAYLFGDHRSRGHRSHGHNGGAPGISAEFAFYPELGYTLVVFSNYGEAAGLVSSFARELIERQPN